MTKRDLIRRVKEFNRLSDRAVEQFEIWVDNRTAENWDLLESIGEILAAEQDRLQLADDKRRLHKSSYLYEYNGLQYRRTVLEVWG